MDTNGDQTHRSSSRPSIDEDISTDSIDRVPTAEPVSYPPYSPYIITLLIPASIFGVLARLGLTAIATHEGNAIFPLAYSQALGCLLIGFTARFRESLGHYYGPLYIAITTGFCGSLTTFSSWQMDIFDSWLNSGRYPRSGFYDAVDGVAKIAFTLALSLGSVSFGHHMACQVSDHPALQKQTRRSISKVLRTVLLMLSVLCYTAVFPAYLLMPRSFRHKATASLLFAFPGTFTRYTLSTWLNRVSQKFPMGTFTANILGTAILAGLHVIQSQRTNGLVCSILQGLIDGFCGCLTTVSTYAVEVRTDRKSVV